MSTPQSAKSRARRSGCARTFRRRCSSAHRASTTAANWSCEDSYGEHAVKLAAGSLVLYPAGSLHHVKPVTCGVRLAAFFWVQSMVRDDGDRTMLFDLDSSIQHVAAALPEHPAVLQLTGVYHNLLRRWAEC